MYGHRGLDEARCQVGSLLRHIGIPRGVVLDAGCGNGRHLAALRERKIQALGCDLSAHLLGTATTRGPVFQCDLRAIPLPSRSCGLVASFFTGFGYLDRPSDDLALLAELARLVAPGGWLHLDLPDPISVRKNLVARDRTRWSDAWVTQKRWMAGNQVFKGILIARDDGLVSEYVERVRLWDPDILEQAARQLGLSPSLRLGDLNGNRWEPGSPRCGLVLRRESA